MTKDFSTAIENVNINKVSKNKFKIFIYSIRKNAISIIFCLFTLCLIIFSTTNLPSAKNGLILWATAVVPSLFPFFVATELLSHTNIISILGKYFTPIMRPLFGVPGEASFAFLMGLISGYPVGAKIVSNFKENGICTKEEAERMLAFTNNSGPLFIIGTVGISLLGNSKVGSLLFVTHVLSCITVGILLNINSRFKENKNVKLNNTFCRKNKVKSNNISFDKDKVKSNNIAYGKDKVKSNNSTFAENKVNSNNISFGKNEVRNLNNENVNSTTNFSSLGEILGKSITNATSTVLLIGGFVVIFSVVISILNQSGFIDFCSTAISPILSIFNIPTDFSSALISGFVELTNGVNLVASINLEVLPIKIILCAFLLGFGGLSVLLQVFSIISKSGLSIKTYFLGKLLQGIIAGFYTFIALQFIHFI